MTHARELLIGHHSLRWSEVDLSRSCLRLENSKTREKVIPIGPPAVQILSTLKEHRRGEFVFPTEVGAGYYVGTDKIMETCAKGRRARWC